MTTKTTASTKTKTPVVRAKASRATPVKPAPKLADLKPVIEPKPAKVDKDDELVRHTFTLPESEYALFSALKKRCMPLGMVVKKSVILRAALSTFAALDDATMTAAVQRVDAIKTRRTKA